MTLLRESISSGMPSWTTVTSELADSRGQFRFASLSKGIYTLLAASQVINCGESNYANTDHCLGYALTFLGGMNDIASASIVPLSDGEIAHVVLKQDPVRFYQVRIPLPGIKSDGSVQISAANGQPVSEFRYEPQSGEVVGLVPNGRYELNLKTDLPALFGKAYFTVAGTNVTTGPIPMFPPRTVVAHIHKSSTRETPAAFTEISLRRESSISDAGNIGFSASSEAGELLIKGVTPGQYRVSVFAPGYFVSAMSSGVTDLANQTLLVTEGSSSLSVDVELDTGTTNLSISVLDGDSTPKRRSFVYLLPISGSSEYRETVVNPGQVTALQDVVPGSYRLLALPHPIDIAYKDPEALERFSRFGIELTTGKGEHIAVRLSLPPDDELPM